MDYDVYAEGEAVLGWLNATTQGYITVTPVARRCLSPGRPNPTHRYDHVVATKTI